MLIQNPTILFVCLKTSLVQTGSSNSGSRVAAVGALRKVSAKEEAAIRLISILVSTMSTCKSLAIPLRSGSHRPIDQRVINHGVPNISQVLSNVNYTKYGRPSLVGWRPSLLGWRPSLQKYGANLWVPLATCNASIRRCNPSSCQQAFTKPEVPSISDVL